MISRLKNPLYYLYDLCTCSDLVQTNFQTKQLTHQAEEIFYILGVNKFFAPLPGTNSILGSCVINLSKKKYQESLVMVYVKNQSTMALQWPLLGFIYEVLGKLPCCLIEQGSHLTLLNFQISNLSGLINEGGCCVIEKLSLRFAQFQLILN